MRAISRLVQARVRLCQANRFSSKDYSLVSHVLQDPVSRSSVWWVRRVLNRNPEIVLQFLDLEPNPRFSTDRDLRVGSKGSLSVSQTDELAGQWYSFESGEKGDMLDLIIKYKDVSDEKALELAKLLIKGQGLSGVENSRLETLADEERRKEREKEKEEKEIKKMNFIKKILSECQPLEGTLAEEYLRNIRGIENISGENLKFHPGFTTRTKTGKYIKVPGLVAVASHPLSASQNIQITFLDPLTANKHSQVLVSRRTYGGFSTGGVSTFCTISQGNSDVTYVSEGVETGLSLLQVRPDAHVIACLGKHNLPKLDPQTTHHKVVLLWDNDGLEVKSDKILLRSLEVLKNGGRRTYLLVPPLIQGREKTDLNDILLELGVEGLEDVLQSSLRRVELR